MLYVVTGPPAAGKSTWVQEQATHGDITIDFDALANTLTPPGEPHSYPDHIIRVVKEARKAAIHYAVGISRLIDVYIIHSTPSAKQLGWYERQRAKIITIDPGHDVVMERCKQLRPAHMLDIAEQWYENQSYIPFA
jgi:hypothetical protein